MDHAQESKLCMDLLQQSENVCSPVSNLHDLWTYPQNPPKWIEDIIDMKPRCNYVVQNSCIDCHFESNQFVPKVRLDSQSVPRTLVCHDMKGGYLEDKYVTPVNIGNGYTFFRWSQIDIFVYFSHHLVTIPPLAWINVAHTNGVKILGTVITEWTAGEEICQKIFLNDDTLQKFVNVLTDICILFKLDGWLLNIENKVLDTSLLKELIKRLTVNLHIKKPGSLVIWYDSVIEDGSLKWQNELNEHNRCFFDLCDGIFLNYAWNEDNLKNTVKLAEHRNLDVYVGLDIFGRNFYKGGRFNTYLAAEKVRQHNLSLAIFAQGWTYETLDQEPVNTFFERFVYRDNVFWKSLWPYLYTHPICGPFQTSFFIGADSNWFKLSDQQIQLSHFLYGKEDHTEAENIPTLLNTCSCLQLLLNNDFTSCLISNAELDPSTTYIHHLFYTDFEVDGKVVIYYYTKVLMQDDNGDFLNLIALVKNVNGCVQKIVCHGKKQAQIENNSTLLELNPTENQDIINMINTQHPVSNDWNLKCYLLEINNGKILDVGAEVESRKTACICGIGFMKIIKS